MLLNCAFFYAKPAPKQESKYQVFNTNRGNSRKKVIMLYTSKDSGSNIVELRDTLGHASMATTNKYLHSKRSNSSALRLAV